MTINRKNTVRAVGIALLTVALAMVTTTGASAKKKKKKAGNVDVTKTVNLPIPDRTQPPGSQDGILTSTIEVGKQFQGMKVRDVNVTVQTLGLTGMDPSGDLRARLAAPNGAHATLFFFLDGLLGAPNPSIGPLTLDDEALLDLGGGNPHNATELYAPWAGSAAPLDPLFPMDNGPVRGTWTLIVSDQNSTAGETSNLVSWRLNVVAGRPFQTK